MKMLCIRGRTAPQHTGVFSGRVYEVDLVHHCCETRALAQGSVWKKNVKLNCQKCNVIVLAYAGCMVPWSPDRFVPWQPDVLHSIVHEAKTSLLTRKAKERAEKTLERTR